MDIASARNARMSVAYDPQTQALAVTSGLIDVGVIVPGVNDGYVGAAPDVGAFERWDVYLPLVSK